MRIEDDSPEFSNNSWAQEDFPAKSRRSSACREKGDIQRFIKSLLSTPGIRYDKIMRLKALVQSGKYETEDKIQRTAGQLLEFLTYNK